MRSVKLKSESKQMKKDMIKPSSQVYFQGQQRGSEIPLSRTGIWKPREQNN